MYVYIYTYYIFCYNMKLNCQLVFGFCRKQYKITLYQLIKADT